MATAKRRQPPRQASGWQHYGAPAAFLVAVTVAVLLVRGSFGEHVRRTTTTASVPAATTAPPATTAKRASQKPPTAPAAGAETYQVQAGDTFGSIAAAHGTTVAELEALNPDVSSTALHVGQTIRVR